MGCERREDISPQAGGSRKIIHIDMDASSTPVEQRDTPESSITLGGVVTSGEGEELRSTLRPESQRVEVETRGL